LRNPSGSLTAVLLLVLAVVVRIPHLGDPPLEFHPTRQYRSAILARSYALPFLRLSTDEQRAARQAAESLPQIEPPIVEHLSAFAYRLAGREDLRIPRTMSVAVWAAASWLLFVAAAQLFSMPAALLALAVMAFVPYGITASQAIQPDPLMTALVVATVAAAAAYSRQRHWRTLVLLLALGSAAILIKLVAVFFVAPVVLAVSATGSNRIRGVLAAMCWIAIMCLPPALYYVTLRDSAGSYGPFPMLLVDPGFWRGWGGMLARVAWPPLVIAAGAGVVFARPPARGLLAALWFGYAAFGLVFAYHISTHDYYSLPIVPAVALSIGALGEALLAPASTARARSWLIGAGALLAAAGVVASVRAAGVFRPAASDLAADVAEYRRIGRLVANSTRIVALDTTYAYALNYHAVTAAANWPLGIDRNLARLQGRQVTPSLDGLPQSGAEFFVATSQAEFDGQPDLRALLDQRYPVLARSGSPEAWRFVIYDLRRAVVSVTPTQVSLFARVKDGRFSRTKVAVWGPAGTHWRVDVGSDLFDAVPREGSGPADVELVARTPISAVDRSIDVAIRPDSGPAVALKVRFRAISEGGDGPPIGSVDAPGDPVFLGPEPVAFMGWALDDLDLRKVSVEYADASGRVIKLGEAQQSAGRPDVAAAFPNAHDTFRPAWAYILQPSVLGAADRPVVLRFYAEDGDGRRTEIGHRTVQPRR
jgi:hypothetical protein